MKILIAEDDIVSRQVLMATLIKWGHEVVVAVDGNEALAVLQSEATPHLAILDWMMPGVDGVEVCRQVRQLTTAIPTYIILLTAMTETENVVTALEAGADDYLTKPFARNELHARIRVGERLLHLQKKMANRVDELNEALAQRERADAARQASENRFRHLVEHSQGLICTHDLAGTLLSVNPAAARALEYEPSEMTGRSMAEFVTPSYRHLFDSYLKRIGRSTTDSGLLRMVTKSGSQRIWKYDNLLTDEAGHEKYVIGHAQDISEIKKAEAEVRSLSMRDELTGLYNRRGFLALSEQYRKVTRRSKQSFSLIYLDMDGLKQINDTYGHHEGSEALCQLAELLKLSFRESDVIARLGGDEFTILVTDAPCCDLAIFRARLSENLSSLNSQDCRPYQLSFSIGAVCIRSDDNSSTEELLVRADRAMYENKMQKRRIGPLEKIELRNHAIRVLA